jgi:hypothetical protein
MRRAFRDGARSRCLFFKIRCSECDAALARTMRRGATLRIDYGSQRNKLRFSRLKLRRRYRFAPRSLLLACEPLPLFSLALSSLSSLPRALPLSLFISPSSSPSPAPSPAPSERERGREEEGEGESLFLSLSRSLTRAREQVSALFVSLCLPDCCASMRPDTCIVIMDFILWRG